ncbi:MAG: TM2 domain-containing protein [Bacteroidetes bacterium]|nr:TM2 domain-containing protein [Bacteroidota bacterium]
MLLTTLDNMFPLDKLPKSKAICLSREKKNFIRLKFGFSPMNLFISSIFLGILGIDRFLLGDRILGLIKLFAVG